MHTHCQSSRLEVEGPPARFQRPHRARPPGVSESRVVTETFGLTSFHLTTRLDAAKADLKGFVDYVAKLYGPDRMMWGADIGNTPGTLDQHYALLQRMVDATAHMKDADRRAIFFDTANKVFVPGGTGGRISGA